MGDGIQELSARTDYKQARIGHVFEPVEGHKERKWWTPRATVPLILVFGLFLGAPLVGFLKGWKTGMVIGENRLPAPKPNLASEPLQSFPKKFNAYYMDHYGFRVDLVRWHNLLTRKILGISNDDVVIGRDGWLFYTGDGVFADFLGQARFTTAELQFWKERLERRNAWLGARGIKYIFEVAPNKSSIYPEKLPAYLSGSGKKTRLDQLVEYLKDTRSPVEILDLRKALIEAKPQGSVYYPQDTHWNGRGRYVAYLELCKRLGVWFPDLRPLGLGNELTIQTISWSGGDWMLFGLPEENLKYKSEMLVPKEPLLARRVTFEPPADLPAVPGEAPFALEKPAGTGRLLMFHDSFMKAGTLDRETEEMAEHFSRSTFIFLRPEGKWLRQLVERERPTVVIEERVERYLQYIPGVDEF